MRTGAELMKSLEVKWRVKTLGSLHVHRPAGSTGCVPMQQRTVRYDYSSNSIDYYSRSSVIVLPARVPRVFISAPS